MIKEKKCSGCDETKPIKKFSKDKSTKDGYQSYCKVCSRVYHQSRKGKEIKAKYNRSEKGKKPPNDTSNQRRAGKRSNVFGSPKGGKILKDGLMQRAVLTKLKRAALTLQSSGIISANFMVFAV